jgi:peptidoglycan/LPS O-acetylase OafA/YrhL
MLSDDRHTGTPDGVRNIEAGVLLLAAGALLLLVSLFLDWYQPSIDAWEIFEVWDLVLAVLAIVALTALAGRMGFGRPRPASWLAAPAGAALVIVLFAIINPPPLSRSVDGDPDTGLWLALVASVLMAAGALLTVARISVAFSAAPRDGVGPPWSRGRAARAARVDADAASADDPPAEATTRKL